MCYFYIITNVIYSSDGTAIFKSLQFSTSSDPSDPSKKNVFPF